MPTRHVGDQLATGDSLDDRAPRPVGKIEPPTVERSTLGLRQFVGPRSARGVWRHHGHGFELTLEPMRQDAERLVPMLILAAQPRQLGVVAVDRYPAMLANAVREIAGDEPREVRRHRQPVRLVAAVIADQVIVA